MPLRLYVTYCLKVIDREKKKREKKKRKDESWMIFIGGDYMGEFPAVGRA